MFPPTIKIVGFHNANFMKNLMSDVAAMVGVTFNKHFIAIDDNGEHILRISNNGLEKYIPDTRRYADGSNFLQMLLRGDMEIKWMEGDVTEV